MKRPGFDYSPILARLSLISLYIVLGMAIATFAAGNVIVKTPIYPPTENILIRNLLFVIGIMEMGVIQIIKRQGLNKLKSILKDREITYQDLLPTSLVIAAICSSISIYGLVTVIAGSSIEALLLFIAISLLAFQLFRIREKDLTGLTN